MNDKRIYDLIKENALEKAQPDLADLYDRIEKYDGNDERIFEEPPKKKNSKPKYSVAVVATAAALVLVFLGVLISPQNAFNSAESDSMIMEDESIASNGENAGLYDEFGSVDDELTDYGFVDGQEKAPEQSDGTSTTIPNEESNNYTDGSSEMPENQQDAYSGSQNAVESNNSLTFADKYSIAAVVIAVAGLFAVVFFRQKSFEKKV